MKRVQVLIVGAGPTGLTAAAELTRLGVEIAIIEKAAARSDKSKAIGVHAGTLEALAASFGADFSAELIAGGHATRRGYIHIDDLAPVSVDMTTIPSVYNFILILPQGKTEQYLEEKLNALDRAVQRQTELISLTQNSEGVSAKVRSADGSESTIFADFVIGADGAHSVVRHQVNASFTGEAYGNDNLLADVEISWQWEYGGAHIFISDLGLVGCFPFSDKNNYRIVCAQTEKRRDGDLSFDEFSATVKTMTSGRVSASNPTWLTRFSVSHRIVDHMQHGRVFLAGDAAHIHSPVGGQGMNTGIQDALNLSSKLARVILQKAPVDSLKNYEIERLAVARKVVANTDRAARFGVGRENPATRVLKKMVKKYVIPVVASQRFVQRKILKGISQVAIARAEIKNRL